MNVGMNDDHSGQSNRKLACLVADMDQAFIHKENSNPKKHSTKKSIDEHNGNLQDLLILHYKGVKLLKEHKTRRLSSELNDESEEDAESDSEHLKSQFIVEKMRKRIDANLGKAIKIQSRVLLLI